MKLLIASAVLTVVGFLLTFLSAVPRSETMMTGGFFLAMTGLAAMSVTYLVSTALSWSLGGRSRR